MCDSRCELNSRRERNSFYWHSVLNASRRWAGGAEQNRSRELRIRRARRGASRAGRVGRRGLAPAKTVGLTDVLKATAGDEQWVSDVPRLARVVGRGGPTFALKRLCLEGRRLLAAGMAVAKRGDTI